MLGLPVFSCLLFFLPVLTMVFDELGKFFIACLLSLIKRSADSISLKSAPKTGAERQRSYREKQKNEMGKRIDMRVDLSTYNRLESLALYGNESMKDVLMRLIEEEYLKQLNAKDGKFDQFLKELHNNVTL